MKPAAITPALLFSTATLLAANTAQAIDVGTTAADHNHRFEGWGTSLAWWANEVGGQSNAQGREDLLDAFFDPNNGLGINFVRYNIGADQNPDVAQISRPGARIQSFVPNEPSNINDPSTWQYDFSRDATQRLILDEAIARGVTNVEAFSNSAPWWLTINQSSTGNSSGNNLNTNNYDEFIEYQLTVADHFEDNLGIQFNTITPFNEPGSGFWRGGTNQEGLIISQGSRQSSFIREYGQELIDRGSVIGLVGPEETSTDQTADSLAQYGNVTRSFLAQVNTHTYSFNGGSGQSDSERLFNEASENDLKIYATEYGTGQGAVRLARQINSDIRYLDARAWTYWQVLEDNNGSGWGLGIANFNGTNPRFDLQDQYFAFKQFSTYIRPGSEIIELEDQENITAAYDPRTGITSVIVTNAQGDSDVTGYSFDLDREVTGTRLIRTTDENNDLRTDAYASLGLAAQNGNTIAFDAVGNAITSAVIYHRPNLINNPTLGSDNAPAFEGWQIQGNVSFDDGQGQDNTGDGSGSIRLQTNASGNAGRVYQTGIGDADTDLTGVAYQLSLDVEFRNEGDREYNADTYLAIEFYGADDEILTSVSLEDYETEIEPAFAVKRDGFESSVDGSDPNDNVYRTFLSGRFEAPEGTRFVRPVIRFDGVEGDSNSVVSLDNIRLQEVHPEAAAREWNIEGGGDWSDNRAWANHSLVDNNQVAYFGNAIDQASTVTSSADQEVTGVTFFSDHAYELSGSGTLTITSGAGSNAGLVDVRWGGHRVSLNTELADDLRLQVLPDASVTFDGGFDAAGHTVAKLGAGTAVFEQGFELNGGTLSAYASAAPTIVLGSDAVLDGNYELLLAPGQTLELGDVFALASYTGLNDTFDSILLPELTDDLDWVVDYGTTLLTASVISASLLGDFNGDGFVGQGDLDPVLLNFGSSEVPAGFDLGGLGPGAQFDNLIGQNELDLVLLNFGSGSSTATANVVPEPATVSLLAAGSLLLGRRRRRASRG